MLLDAQNTFSDAQAVTTTAASTNYMNLGATATPPGSTAALTRDLGGSDLDLLVQVVTDFDGLTSLAVSIEVDDNASFSSPTTVASSAAVPAATLKAGYRFSLSDIPQGTDQQYLRLKYTVVGTATAGKITAGIVAGLPTNGR